MRSRLTLFAGLVLVAAACTPTGTAAPTGTTPTQGPATQAASQPPASGAAGATTVKAESVGDAGTILVDAASGMTLYNFTNDVKDSGKSACTGGCLETWPALTVAAGETPTGDSAVTGTLSTITREDNGELQVTYNGLPLYFFKNDSAPGDLNGVYDKWVTVAP